MAINDKQPLSNALSDRPIPGVDTLGAHPSGVSGGVIMPAPAGVPMHAGLAAMPAGTAVPNDQVVDVLTDLLENARDGEYGFRLCAEEVDMPRLKPLFQDRAEQCRETGVKLEQWIRRYGGEVPDGGSVQGAVHRGWVHVKAAVGADSEKSILEECERGEDAAIARYRKALKQELPLEVRAMVQHQADGAQRNHDRIRDLRDAARANS